MPRSPKLVVPAHVPLARSTRGARHRIGPAHDPDDQITGREARPGWRFEHLTQALVADDQPFLSGWRRAVGAVGDLPVGPADTDRHPAHQQRAVLLARVRHFLDAGGPFLARPYCHRAHLRIVSPGSRGWPHPVRVMTAAAEYSG